MTNQKVTSQQNTHILPCKTFISIGDCPFRNRCMYIHDMRIQNPNAHKTSRAKSKKIETEGDLFYWPSMETDSNIYSVPNEDASMYSIWNYFVDFCQDCKYQQLHNNNNGNGNGNNENHHRNHNHNNNNHHHQHHHHKQKNQLNDDMNRYTHHKRLPVFLELASAPSATHSTMSDFMTTTTTPTSTSLTTTKTNFSDSFNSTMNHFVDEKNKENAKFIRNATNYHQQKYMSGVPSTPPRNNNNNSNNNIHNINSSSSLSSTPSFQVYSGETLTPRASSSKLPFYNSPTSIESTPNLEMIPNWSLYNQDFQKGPFYHPFYYISFCCIKIVVIDNFRGCDSNNSIIHHEQ